MPIPPPPISADPHRQCLCAGRIAAGCLPIRNRTESDPHFRGVSSGADPRWRGRRHLVSSSRCPDHKVDHSHPEESGAYRNRHGERLRCCSCRHTTCRPFCPASLLGRHHLAHPTKSRREFDALPATCSPSSSPGSKFEGNRPRDIRPSGSERAHIWQRSRHRRLPAFQSSNRLPANAFGAHPKQRPTEETMPSTTTCRTFPCQIRVVRSAPNCGELSHSSFYFVIRFAAGEQGTSPLFVSCFRLGALFVLAVVDFSCLMRRQLQDFEASPSAVLFAWYRIFVKYCVRTRCLPMTYLSYSILLFPLLLLCKMASFQHLVDSSRVLFGISSHVLDVRR
mmetsp:Transcript_22991/g.65149  ORF Transcript_22991/g.65149 Transcript_22991/m.65149 type:complete len:337 (+) Transcript_22991:61-1071(+)